MSPARAARRCEGVRVRIDFHTHMLDEELREICTSRNAITGFGKKQAPPSANLRKFLDPELQIADMDERGIDMHVVFTGPVHMSTWWAEAQTAEKLFPYENPINRTIEIVANSMSVFKWTRTSLVPPT